MTAERGDLAQSPLPRLLLRLLQERFSGTLSLSRERTHKRFSLLDGFPTISESSLPRESLGNLLEEREAIDATQHAALRAHVARKRCPEAAAILGLKLLGSRELLDLMREATAKRLVGCMGWPGGSYGLDTAAPVPESARALRADPIPLIHSAIETHWSAERILDDLCDRLDRYPQARPELGKALSRLHSDPEIDRVIAALAGSGSLESVAGVAIRSPRALAALWTIDAAGWIEYAEAAPESASGPTSEGGPQVEIVTRSVSSAGATAQPAAVSSPAKAPNDAAAEKLSNEIHERHAGLDELDHYAALGLSADAPAGQIRKAYFMAAKRYHPDGLRRLGLDDETQRRAGEIFARIAEANEVLSDASRREAYDAEQAGGVTEEEAERAAEAEAFFRKGSVLVKMGDFRGAAPFFEKAVERWPDEPAYQASLGWSLFRKNPPERERALEHLKRAAELDPGNPEIREWLTLAERG